MRNEVFYNQDGIIVRRTCPSDADRLVLRDSDVQEIWASDHLTPKEALKLSLAKSILALTVEDQGEPIAMFGINPESILGNRAVVWLLASDGLDRIKRRFARHSRQFVQMMLEYYPFLFNYVDARNQKSIEWLKFCGAKIEDAKPYGAESLPFHFFSFKRGQ